MGRFRLIYLARFEQSRWLLATEYPEGRVLGSDEIQVSAKLAPTVPTYAFSTIASVSKRPHLHLA